MIGPSGNDRQLGGVLDLAVDGERNRWKDKNENRKNSWHQNWGVPASFIFGDPKNARWRVNL